MSHPPAVDEQSVFVSEEGDVRHLPDQRGQSRAVEAKFPPRAWERSEVDFETMVYTPLSSQSSTVQKAILRLLQERDAEAALVDRCDEALHSLMRGPIGVTSGEEWGRLFNDLYERKRRRERER